MWTYWALQEGTLAIEPAEFTDNRGAFPPVTHVDSDEPLYDDITGLRITSDTIRMIVGGDKDGRTGV